MLFDCSYLTIAPFDLAAVPDPAVMGVGRASPAVRRKTAPQIRTRLLDLFSDVFSRGYPVHRAALLDANESIPECAIVEHLGHHGKPPHTARIDAKYAPQGLRNWSACCPSSGESLRC